MRFTKMHGAGNDYVYVDCFNNLPPQDPAEVARRVSDRHFGIGGDGLVLICPSNVADARMRMFNADGSEPEMCGNAIRCVAKYIVDHGIVSRTDLRIETGRGVLPLLATVHNGKVTQVRVNMGVPVLDAEQIPTLLSGSPPTNVPLDVAGRQYHVTCVSMGNPHCVIFVDEISDNMVLRLGPQIEVHSVFPNRVNAEFARVRSRNEIQLRVWERGSGETLACGTGASATVVAAVLNGLTDRTVLVRLPGGDLSIEWAQSGEVFMTGPATEVFSGDWPE